MKDIEKKNIVVKKNPTIKWNKNTPKTPGQYDHPQNRGVKVDPSFIESLDEMK
jgi:hypothetical protein